MTLQEVNEYRKLCANFCGWVNLNDESFPEYLDESGNFFGVKDLLFDTDWNWIMVVIDKIEKLNLIFKIIGSPTLSEKWYSYTVIIQQNEFTHISKDVYIVKYESDYSNNETKLEAVVQAINKFLISYNE